MSLADFLGEKMPVSLNTSDPALIAEMIDSGNWALVARGECFAVLSREVQKTVCIEMIEGPGGVRLTGMIVERATKAGLRCEGWVFCKSRAKLAAKCGMRLTGAQRISHSGKVQFQVST